MFKINGKKLTIPKVEVTLTERQLYKFKTLCEENQRAYIDTLLGKKILVRVPKFTKPYNHHVPTNKYLNIQKTISNTNFNHYPEQLSIGEWIGVEIECFLPYSDFDTSDEAENTLDRKIKAAKLSRVTIKGDGSLDSEDGYGIEVCFLFNSSRGYDDLKKLCDILNDLGAFVNDTCGLHVHLDCRDLITNYDLTRKNVRKRAKRFLKALPILRMMQPKSRLTNTFCKPGISTRNDRYYAINITAFQRHKTIEIRLHSGSTNFVKISNWIKLLKFIKNTPIIGTVQNYSDFVDKYALPDVLLEYVEKRILKNNPEFLGVQSQNEERAA